MVWVTLVVALLQAGAATPAAQPWTDAYRAGEYERAADLLHAAVSDFDRILRSGDPEPFWRLAFMYSRGQGVVRDPVAACTMAKMANATASVLPPMVRTPEAYDVWMKEKDRFESEYCNQLPPEARLTVARSLGSCYAFGMPEEVLAVGEHAVRVGRTGTALADAPDDKTQGLANCPVLIARVRAFSVTPPEDAAPGVKARHFLEILSWQSGRHPQDGSVSYELSWDVQEVQAGKLQRVAMQPLMTSTVWPRPALPSDLDARLTLEMIRSGPVRWRLDGAPPKRGWFMLPEARTR